ncbi:hypothetical protein BJV82DRAFT_529743 [Fennellomyces sp. T-0311]|nr:hypothetical protein BJV82DRAFT_529743 [Fennellomyces sp. T-0311]
MAPSDLDHALRDLEKQVMDFSLTVDNPVSATPNNSRDIPPLSSSTHPMHRHPSTRRRPTQVSDDDDDDDNVCVAQLRHHPRPQQQPVVSRSNTLKSPPRDVVSGLVRSASSGGNSRSFKTTEPVPPLPTNAPPKDLPRDDSDQDLRAAMQCAWAVLEAGGDTTETNNKTTDNQQPIAATENSAAMQGTVNKRGVGVPIKAITIRIYINDGSNHKTVQLTNLLTAAMVVQYLRKKGLLDKSEEWTLFEIANSHDIERPLRDWEIVMDTTSTWEQDTKNMLLVKKYKYRDSLMADGVLQKRYPPHYGWLSIEYKKGRWQKRFCYIMDNTIHHAKDTKGSGSVPLCHLSSFDVYTMLLPVRGSPTEYVFAVRAQDKPHIFERPEDYMHLLAADDYDSLRQWVLSIRNAKSTFQYQLYPHRIINPLGPVDLPPPSAPIAPKENKANNDENVPTRSGTLRRHKSTKDLQKSNTLSRHSSRRGRNDGPLIDGFERDPFSKGSLLATSMANSEIESVDSGHSSSRQSPQVPDDTQASGTLIQLDDKVHFSKGSLLDKSLNSNAGVGESRLSRSKSTRETQHNHSADGGEPRRYASVRRKPTTSSRSRRHDVPMPNNAGVPVPGNGPLLRPEENAGQQHTRELMERQIKPLVNFNSPSTFDPRRR